LDNSDIKTDAKTMLLPPINIINSSASAMASSASSWPDPEKIMPGGEEIVGMDAEPWLRGEHGELGRTGQSGQTEQTEQTEQTGQASEAEGPESSPPNLQYQPTEHILSNDLSLLRRHCPGSREYRNQSK
jgi:hypothetical protein